MRILHTSDWHIGKQLQKVDLSDEIKMFFGWLLKAIAARKIDLLLVSGDIFDHANPSQAAYKVYYDFLKSMLKLDCKIVITGGNHDSASVLNAPKELLQAMDITVVGGATENLEDMIFKFQKDKIDVVVAAIPYLKDNNIRKSAPGESYADKVEQIKDGLRNYFHEVNECYKKNYKGAKFIVMGHLFVQGAESMLSDGVRDIQIGNQAGVEHAIFEGVPDYVALGHIHKPYPVDSKKHIYYCGSPVSFSFSEKEDQKQINIVEITDKSIDVEIVPIPVYRELVSFEGTYEEVAAEVSGYVNKYELDALGEIVITEKSESVGLGEQVEDLMINHGVDGLRIVKRKLTYEDRLMGGSKVFDEQADVADFTAGEMFEKRLELETTYNNQKKKELRSAFQEILENLGEVR